MSSSHDTLLNALQLHQTGNLDQASNLYHEVLEADPQNPDALHLLGVLSHQGGNHETAVDYISQAIAINDSAATYHSNLGTSYRELGKTDDAIASFRTAIQHDSSFAGAHYNLGISLAALGQIDDAIASFEDALRVDPNFTDAHNNLGRMYAIQHRYAEAITQFQQVLEVAPDVAEIHYNLGNAQHGNGEWTQAIASYEKAIELSPHLYNALNNLGSIYKDQGEFDKAIECFERALAIKPDFSEAHYNLGACQQQRSQFAQASASFEHAAEGLPQNDDVQIAHIRSLEKSGQLDEAERLCRQHLDGSTSANAEIAYLLGDILLSQGRIDEATKAFEQTLIIDGRHFLALNNLGKLHVDAERFTEAAECFQKLTENNSDNASAHYNLGNVFKEQLKWDEAVACYEHALELYPEFVEAHINLGIVLCRQKKLDRALEQHHKAGELRPNDAEAIFHLAQTELISGDLKNGFNNYEWRWQYDANARNVAGQVWTGTSLNEQRLFVYAEQGVGDEVMFASCLPDVLQHTTECWLECDPRLVPLFQRSFPLAHVIARPYTDEEQLTTTPLPYDQQIALGSLPRYLRTTTDAFPVQRRYLAADPKKVQQWRERYAELGSGLTIGISWQGGKPGSSRRNRSQSLLDWASILKLPNVQWVNLQYGDHQLELEQASQNLGVTIHDWDDADPLKDLDNLAAQIAALDLVVSVDNATVHFAGALGIPCWALLPYAPNWRWMLDRNDTPWYASVLLYRQERPGEWATVFDHVAENLKTITNSPDPAAVSPPTENINAADDSAQDDQSTAPFRPSLGAAEWVQTADANSDSEAAKEKEKYEKIWTHGAYREYSPGLHDMDKLPLLDFLRRFEVKTILDSGCGSGKLMQRLITEHKDEFDVHGFDISENCLDPFFDDIKDEILTVGCLWNPADYNTPYDAIICTDVMEHIPTEHVPAVLSNFRNCTKKLAYLAIALFPDNFGPRLLGEPLHLTVEEPQWWFDKFRQAGFSLNAYAVEKHETGRDMWLHAFLTPQ